MAKPRTEKAGRDQGVTVVAIDGRLVESSRLKSILGVIGRARRRVVLVAGGGGLGDAVARIQSDIGVSVAAAHRMGVLAMHQSAIALADLQPRLIPVETLAGMRKAVAAGRIPVWLPLRLSDRDRSILTDGTVGADGLAARLAERLGASLVLLVKPRRVRRGASACELASEGLVDETFAAITSRAGLRFRLVGSSEATVLAGIVGALGGQGLGSHQCRGAGRGRRSRRSAARPAALSKH